MHAVMQPAPKLKKPKVAEHNTAVRKLLPPIEHQVKDAEVVADAQVVADS